jgi:hypothetical protein
VDEGCSSQLLGIQEGGQRRLGNIGADADSVVVVCVLMDSLMRCGKREMSWRRDFVAELA